MLRTLFAVAALLVAACTSSPAAPPAATPAPATPAAPTQAAAGATVSLATGHFVGPNGMLPMILEALKSSTGWSTV